MLNLVSWLCEVVTSGRTLVGFKIYSRHRINPELRQVNRLVKPPLNSNIFSSGSLKKQVCPGERSNKFTRRLKRRQKKKTKKTTQPPSGQVQPFTAAWYAELSVTETLTLNRSLTSRITNRGRDEDWRLTQREKLELHTHHCSLVILCKLPVWRSETSNETFAPSVRSSPKSLGCGQDRTFEDFNLAFRNTDKLFFFTIFRHFVNN